MLKKFREYRKCKNAIRQLNQLDDRSLADMGIKRSEIAFIVRKSTGSYGGFE